MAKAVKVKSPSQRAKDTVRRQREESQKRRRMLMLFAAAAAAAAVAALVLVGALSRGGGNSSAPVTVALTSEGKTLGSPTAPVTITAWEDFQCPFCKQANSAALAQVITNYVNSGQVKIVYQQFPFLGNGGSKDESVLAAEASEAAAEQGKFWPYHDALFAAQSTTGENKGIFTVTKLKDIASGLGLDMTAFNAALDSGKYKQAVLDQKAEGEKLGVTSTPTFFVNGEKITGAQPYSVFKNAIDKALQAAS